MPNLNEQEFSKLKSELLAQSMEALDQWEAHIRWYFISKDQTQRLVAALEAAMCSDPDNAYFLSLRAHLYYSAPGAIEYEPEVIRLFAKAEKLGFARAMRWLGYIYEVGYGQLLANNALAQEKYVRASELGDASAMFYLAIMFQDGIGVSRDIEKAMGLYRQATAKRYTPAMCNLAWMLRRAEGTAENFSEAIKLYQDAIVIDNNPAAMHALGCMSMLGQGMKIDYKAAEELFKKSIALGYHHAICSYAMMHKLRQCTNPSLETAVELFVTFYKSAKTNDSRERAIKELQEIATQGCIKANYNLVLIYLTNSIALPDKAKEFYIVDPKSIANLIFQHINQQFQAYEKNKNNIDILLKFIINDLPADKVDYINFKLLLQQDMNAACKFYYAHPLIRQYLDGFEFLMLGTEKACEFNEEVHSKNDHIDFLYKSCKLLLSGHELGFRDCSALLKQYLVAIDDLNYERKPTLRLLDDKASDALIINFQQALRKKSKRINHGHIMALNAFIFTENYNKINGGGLTLFSITEDIALAKLIIDNLKNDGDLETIVADNKIKERLQKYTKLNALISEILNNGSFSNEQANINNICKK